MKHDIKSRDGKYSAQFKGEVPRQGERIQDSSSRWFEVQEVTWKRTIDQQTKATVHVVEIDAPKKHADRLRQAMVGARVLPDDEQP